MAVWPETGDVFAPISGTVASAMPHAFGIAGDDGVEVLVHVGVDTVSMNGDGFQVWVKAGDHVAAGDAILTFNKDKVAKAGYKDIIMTIITNSDDLANIQKVAAGTVAAGDKLMQTA
ncbi:MAG: PTS glucose transporter subunit IIA [Atopobiaceae bacterium]|nr:PTS glucose transporter subunit IIA [Atopobiaceae bacterium]